MALRTSPTRTISARQALIGLLVIPLLSLAGLWVFTLSITLTNVDRNQQSNTIVNGIAPGAIALEEELSQERGLTLGWLAANRNSAQLQTELAAARRATDTYAKTFHAEATSIAGSLDDTGKAHLNSAYAELATLAKLRAAVDSGADSPQAALSAYSVVDTVLYGFIYNAYPVADPTYSLMLQTSISDARAADITASAIGLISGGIAAGGHLSEQERVLLGQIVGQQDLVVGDAFQQANAQLTPLITRTFESASYHQLTTLESKILDASPSDPIGVSAQAFQSTAAGIQQAQGSVLSQLAQLMGAKAAQLHNGLQDQLYLAGGLGLLAVIVSVFVAVRFGGRIRAELTGLYDSARQIAEERLPRLAERLRRGEDVDVETEAPPLKEGRITETATVARAFSTVQRTAVEAAVGQASLRKGLNQVFVSLSLRSQSLLHRQLGLLDDMERATSDPSALADLFRLDHLTTRMRRHAEGLLILAGSTPGRGWRDPVLLVDVLNAAIAEVEDYVRVDVLTESADSVAGIAVSDVIHLLAELIENATSFSPPTTRVEVRGEIVSHGFAIEIEDRGLGMSPQQLAAVNERLTNPPEFDLANSDQLGLFVAARLAERHEVSVFLRHSPFGGTTAIVLLPQTIIVSAQDMDRQQGIVRTDALPYAPAGASDDGNPGHQPPFGLTGRHHRFGAVPSDSETGPRRTPPGPQPDRAGVPVRAGTVPPPGTPPPWNTAPAGRPAAGGQLAGDSGPGDVRVTDILSVDGSRPGLPRRSRGTSLAPRLRLQPGAAPGARADRQGSAGPVAPEPPARSPEEAADMLSTLQDGWERARIADFDYLNEEEGQS